MASDIWGFLTQEKNVVLISIISLSGVVFSAIVSAIIAAGQVKANAKYARISRELTNALGSRKVYFDLYHKGNFVLSEEVKAAFRLAVDKREYLYSAKELEEIVIVFETGSTDDASKFRNADRLYLRKIKQLRKKLGL